MNVSDLKPGTVIFWNDFNIPNYPGKIKDTWFIYLGKDSVFDCPIYIYCHRFTSQIQHFTDTGDRKNDLTISFSKKQYEIFDDHCIINFREKNYSIPTYYIENNLNNIQLKGILPEDAIRRIWNLLQKAPHYSPKILDSIKKSLNNIGITGLK